MAKAGQVVEALFDAIVAVSKRCAEGSKADECADFAKAVKDLSESLNLVVGLFEWI